MAGTGANGIKGGNFQMFEQFLNRSGADVYLATPVCDDALLSSCLISDEVSIRYPASHPSHPLRVCGL
jgi:hypothetical protein